VIAPAAFADVSSDDALVDLFPALDSVGAAGIGQSLARAPAHLVRIVRQQHIARRQVGGVQVEDVLGEFPAQHHKTGELGPGAIGDEQRVGADIEGRRRTEFTTPQSDGADVPEILVQHVRHHAQHVRQLAVFDLIFEVADDDCREMPAHSSTCLAPIMRSRAG
jgi:hypothetical protein